MSAQDYVAATSALRTSVGAAVRAATVAASNAMAAQDPNQLAVDLPDRLHVASDKWQVERDSTMQ